MTLSDQNKALKAKGSPKSKIGRPKKTVTDPATVDHSNDTAETEVPHQLINCARMGMMPSDVDLTLAEMHSRVRTLFIQATMQYNNASPAQKPALLVEVNNLKRYANFLDSISNIVVVM